MNTGVKNILKTSLGSLYDSEACDPSTRAVSRFNKSHKDVVATLGLAETPAAASVLEIFYTSIADVEVCRINTCLGFPLLSRVPEPLDCDAILAAEN